MSYFKNPIVRIENGIYTGSDDRASLYDLLIPENFNGKLIVFVHGYKGFKDWGAWNLVEFTFVDAGFGFAKINLTHNGGTTEQAIDFPDLEAFGRNTYSKEIEDIHYFMDHLSEIKLPEHSLHLIGHSRGGGDVIIAASESKRITSFATWAAISSISQRMPTGEKLETWRSNGVRFELNSRTHQEMPVFFSLYEDFIQNETRLDIREACRKIHVPRLIIHGSNDTAVSIGEGEQLAEWLTTPLIEIPGASHTFGASHPWKSFTLPEDLKTVCELTIRFFNDQIV